MIMKNTEKYFFPERWGGASSEGKWCGRKNGNGRSEVQRQYCTNEEKIKQLSLILIGNWKIKDFYDKDRIAADHESTARARTFCHFPLLLCPAAA